MFSEDVSKGRSSPFPRLDVEVMSSVVAHEDADISPVLSQFNRNDTQGARVRGVQFKRVGQSGFQTGSASVYAHRRRSACDL